MPKIRVATAADVNQLVEPVTNLFRDAANEAAHRFYQRHGFVPQSVTLYADL
jgi:hypothetical protein